MNLLINVLVLALVCGLIALLVRKAPESILPGSWKEIVLYIVLVVFVILVIGILTGGPALIVVR